jgi:D-galactarolactone cycloisomerase
MRITRIRRQELRLQLDPVVHAAWDPNPRREFAATIVRVETDAGFVGIGSGDTMVGFGEFEHLFIGQDPLAIGRHARMLEGISFHAGRYWPLETALWDLCGRVCGLPLAMLLGGARNSVPAYASWCEHRSREQRVEDAQALLQAGFRAVKIRLGRGHLEEGLAVVAAVRDAVGQRLELIVDLNQWWRMPGDAEAGLDPAAAERLIERLRDHDVLWVEEPLAGADHAGMRRLAERTGMRIAGGEMVRTFEELLLAVEHDALDVVQPDVVLALGISATRTLADLALRRNRWFTPHTWTNGIGLMANLQVCAGVGGGPYIEFPYDPPAWTAAKRDFMLAAPIEVGADGLLRVPDGPGLGVELDEERVAAQLVADTEARG